MAIKIAERFAEQCDIVSNTSYDTCGTITRSDIDYFTPADLESILAPGGKYGDLNSWFVVQIEMKATCGQKRYVMYDWIMGNADMSGDSRKLLTTTNAKRGPSLTQPFIKAAQMSVLNVDHWNIDDGFTVGEDYTVDVTGPLSDLTGGDVVVRVIAAYGVDMDPKWFNARTRVHIFTRADGNAQDGQWEVVDAALADDGSYVDVLLKDQNAGSTVEYSRGPDNGVLLVGRNNVNDYEQFCTNLPNWDGRKIVPFWYQTSRRTRCIDQNYQEWFARLMMTGTNEAFKRFGDLEITQRNAQDEYLDQIRFVHDFFFNKPISANQTLTLWESLEDIETPTGLNLDVGMGGRLVEKRANFIGVKEQLYRCARVKDLHGEKLNWYEFLDINYDIMRARKSAGRPYKSIDWYTNTVMSAHLQTAYMQYVLAEFGSSNAQWQLKPGESLKAGMEWTTFRVKRPAGVDINIITNEFFDDWYSQNKTQGQVEIGNLLLALDLGKGGIYWTGLGSNKVVRTVGEIEKLAAVDKDWACVMKAFTKQITAISDTGTVIVECPENNLWIWDIADDVPDTTGASGDGSDLY